MAYRCKALLYLYATSDPNRRDAKSSNSIFSDYPMIINSAC